MRPRVALFALLLGTGLLAAGQATPVAGAGFDPDQKPLRLASGIVFAKWQIIAETASTVTIRYPGGAAKVDKKLLPEALRAVYKSDPAAVAAEAKADAEQKAIYDAQVRATQEKQKEEHDARVASSAADSQQAGRARKGAAEGERRARAEQLASVRKEARKYAEHYFRYEYLGGVSGAVVERLDLDLREPREVSGWPGRFAVDGRASLEYFASAGISFQKSSGNAFTVTLEWRDGGADVVDFTNRLAP